MKRTLPLVAALVAAGCSAHQATPAASSAPPPSAPPQVTVTVTVSSTSSPVPAPPPATPAAVGQCSDDDLAVTNGSVQPANAAHHLTLNPGDVASAEAQAYAIDTATGNSCGREGTLVVTPPNDFTARTLPVSLPICSASIGSVD